MFYTIYQITNKETGKTYIGKHQTDNLDDGYMGSGLLLKRAQEKHGLDVFEKTILHVFDNEDEMNVKEAELVTEEFCSRDDTYNLCPGGKGGWGYVNQNGLSGLVSYNKSEKKSLDSKRTIYYGLEKRRKIQQTIEFREKMSKSRSGIKCSINGMQGKIHSKETKSKMSDAHSGKNNSQYGLQWITNGLESKKIRKDDLIPDGWRKGRKMK